MDPFLNSFKGKVSILFCFFFSLVISSVLHAQIMWFDGATTLSSAGASNAQATINDNNQVTVIWVDGTDIKFANYTQSTGWSAEAIAVSAGGAVATPRVVMNNSGQTMITWIEGGTTLKYITRSTFTGSWSSSANVSSDTLNGTFNKLVINNSGQVIAAWQTKPGIQFQINTATFIFGNTWSASFFPRTFPAVEAIALALNDAGQALLNVTISGTSWGGTAVIGFNSTFDTVRSGGFTTQFTLTSTNNLNTSIPPFLSLNSNNLAITSWVWTDNSTIFTAPFNKSWTTTSSTVKSLGNTVTSLQAKMNDSNFSIVAWTENDGVNYYVKVSTVTQFQSVLPWRTRTIYSSTNVLTDVRLTLDNRGESVVVWNENVSGTNVVKGSSVNFLLNNAPVVETLSDTTKSSTVEDVAGNTTKDFVVVWKNNTDTVMVARVGMIRISPPSNPFGAQKTNRFFTQTEYINHIKWNASLSPSVNAYRIFANGFVIGQSSTTSFKHHAQKKGHPILYTITSINSLGEESRETTSIMVP